MAFHQPTRQAIHRIARPAAEERPRPSLQSPIAQEQEANESQTWVLFSPATDITTTSYLAETEPSLETPGRSLQSDLGSLHTLARSDRHVDPAQSHHSAEEDGELDSLDSHLPEFRSLPGVLSQSQQDAHGTQTVFPSHDGLGSFRLDNPAIGPEAQGQLYQFERFNPRRTRKRRESLDRARPELDLEEAQEYEKRRRIEDWRLDHSRYMLEEIQRETRRRRKSQASSRGQTPVASAEPFERPARDDSDNMTWHDEEPAMEDVPPEGFLSHITRTFIQDILGLDERLLSILTGESTIEMEDDLSSTPRASQMVPQHFAHESENEQWRLQMLEKVSRELGMLVNHLSHHPGAFSTYNRMQQMPLPYAGLPVIPELSGAAADVASMPSKPSEPSFPEFLPTVPQSSRPIDIPGKAAETTATEDANKGNTFTKEEWEQDLDIKVVFRYLRSRFTSHESNNNGNSSATYMGPATAQELAAKAARVRQHHPLISRGARAAERRNSMRPASPIILRHHHHHHQSSCASQSTRRSARRSSVSSSRHYWDLGGSLGTGSMVASNGPMGSWGEV